MKEHFSGRRKMIPDRNPEEEIIPTKDQKGSKSTGNANHVKKYIYKILI